MKFLLILTLLLFSQISPKLTRKSEYDYSSYKSVSHNQNLSSQQVTSSSADESAVYIDGSDKITVTDSTITKESGDSSNIENSEFYGVNAAVLVQGGNLEITGGEIITKTQGETPLSLQMMVKLKSLEL